MIISAHRLMALISGINGSIYPYDTDVPEITSWPGIRDALHLRRRDTDYFPRAAVQLVAAHASIASAIGLDALSTRFLRRTPTFFGQAVPDIDAGGIPSFWPRVLAFPPSLRAEVRYQTPTLALVHVDGIQFTIGVRAVESKLYFNWTEAHRDIAGFRGALTLAAAWQEGSVLSWTYDPVSYPSQMALDAIIDSPELSALLTESEFLNDFHASRAASEKMAFIFAALAVTNPAYS